MSEVKTRRAEALALLDKIDPSDRDYLGQDKFCFHLNLWTAERAGYTIKDALGGWEVAPPGERLEFVSFLTDAIPSYTHSVDACLSLPLPPGQRWTTASPVSGSEYVLGWAFIGGGFATTTEIMHRSATLPLAMLLAWWSMQKD